MHLTESLYNKILFCPIELPPIPAGLIEVFDTINFESMNIDLYRNCFHIPILTNDGIWTKFADMVPQLKLWLENYIFDWCYGKIMIITTPAGQINPPHIDCAPHEIFTNQFKFRYVIQGSTSSLCFITNSKQICCPDINQAFVMSGNWPHFMNNKFEKRKYTLAIGRPWNPTIKDKKFLQKIQHGFVKFNSTVLTVNGFNELPLNYLDLFENKYKTNIIKT